VTLLRPGRPLDFSGISTGYDPDHPPLPTRPRDEHARDGRQPQSDPARPHPQR
jgi:hypothetical protein